MQLLMELVGGVFGGLIVVACYIYSNSLLDPNSPLKEVKVKEDASDEWYDKPTNKVSFVITVMILVTIITFYGLKY